MNLQTFYQDLLSMCDITMSTYGRLVVETYSPDGEKIELPLQYDGKPIIFPEKQYINDPQNKDEGVITLHPLSESTLRGTSEVLDILRKAGIIRLCYVGDFLIKKAAELNYNASSDIKHKLNHKLSTLFSGVPEIDKKFIDWFDKLMNEIATDSSKRLFNIYLKPEGEIDKNRYTRVCVISSPLYDELVMAKDSKEIFGVEAPRKKDIQTLIALMEAVFPLLKDNGYIEGSSSTVAPSLIAFMEAMSKIGRGFNKTLEILGKEAKDIADGNTRGVDWDRKANLSHLRNVHPIEEYNIGVPIGDEVSDKQTDIKERKPVTPLTIPTREANTEVSRTTRDEPKEPETTGGFWNTPSRDDRTVRGSYGNSSYGSSYGSYGGYDSRRDNNGGYQPSYSPREDNRYDSNRNTTGGFWNNR